MKTLSSLLLSLLLAAVCVAEAQTPPAAAQAGMHRYLVERTFPPGALDKVDAAVKARVNANNEKRGVRWLMSYANASKTKTYCVYEGPSEAAVRKAAADNGLPVDAVTEVPVTLLPK
ncbi:MAG TPA: DUF4242 domain-containing protein [Steroidobacteraceae bacterium]|nr:DUF4242 domain-containing protein [Steroidobacteraceae bacterium]